MAATVRGILSAYAAFFASLASLFRCALPALLVFLGFGLTGVLAFFAAIPGWEEFGAYELWLFPVSGALLALGFYFAYFRVPLPAEDCPVPRQGGETACAASVRYNRWILWLSLFLCIVALLMTFWGIDWMKARVYFNR
jgi:hypothetical protein